MTQLSNTGPAYYVGIHHCSFHAGEPGIILGVMMVKPDEHSELRPCFMVNWTNKTGSTEYDYCPISDVAHYKIISAQDIFDHKIPEVTQ